MSTLSTPTLSLKQKIDLLSVLLEQHNRQSWAIADLVLEIVSVQHIRLKVLASNLGIASNRLSEFALTAQCFPRATRPDATFQDCLLARRTLKRLPGLNMTLLRVLEEITSLKCKHPTRVREHFINHLKRNKGQSSLSHALCDHEVINRCHLGAWQNVVPQIPDGSVKLVLADPPFGEYPKSQMGDYAPRHGSHSWFRTDSDNNASEEALASTLPLFAFFKNKMATGGCLILFQAGGRPDRPDLLTEAEQHGWDCRHALIWKKATSGVPTDKRSPYTKTFEKVLIFCRRGEELMKHDFSIPSMDVLDCPRITTPFKGSKHPNRLPIDTIHMFQKPDALAEHLIRMHSDPNDLVIEPFGCSAWATRAAAKLHRKWIYIESNKANFAWGSEKLAASLKKDRSLDTNVVRTSF